MLFKNVDRKGNKYRNKTRWEVIDGEAQQILKGRNASGSNDHPIKTYTYKGNKLE